MHNRRVAPGGVATSGAKRVPGVLPAIRNFGKVPKIQILTIEELIKGRRIEFPHIQQETFKAAPRERGAKAEKLSLPFGPPVTE